MVFYGIYFFAFLFFISLTTVATATATAARSAADFHPFYPAKGGGTGGTGTAWKNRKSRKTRRRRSGAGSIVRTALAASLRDPYIRAHPSEPASPFLHLPFSLYSSVRYESQHSVDDPTLSAVIPLAPRPPQPPPRHPPRSAHRARFNDPQNRGPICDKSMRSATLVGWNEPRVNTGDTTRKRESHGGEVRRETFFDTGSFGIGRVLRR